MPSNTDQTGNLTWLGFALATVVMWGLYGVLLHAGQVTMGDAVNGRYKAFLWVGIAYFIAAIAAPLVFLIVRGATWQMPAAGVTWSLLAGLVGAGGAFFVLMAFGARGAPSVVMSIVFAGAPVINAIVATTIAGNWSRLRWPFIFGIVLAAVGGCLVTLYRPIAPVNPPDHANVSPLDDHSP